MRHVWDILGTVVSVSLAASSVNVDQLKLRLQMGYDGTEEARGLVAQEKYAQASRTYADALNLGRKSALAWQEIMIPSSEDDDNNNTENDQDRQQALQWLVEVFCESCRLNMDHLGDLATARADAWAACMFSQYQWRQPLECMKQVCERDEDWLGELQMCQSLLQLEEDELSEEQRDQLSQRRKELDQKLSQN